MGICNAWLFASSAAKIIVNTMLKLETVFKSPLSALSHTVRRQRHWQMTAWSSLVMVNCGSMSHFGIRLLIYWMKCNCYSRLNWKKSFYSACFILHMTWKLCENIDSIQYNMHLTFSSYTTLGCLVSRKQQINHRGKLHVVVYFN